MLRLPTGLILIVPVNASKLNMAVNFTSGNLDISGGARFASSLSDQAINALNISATSDPVAGTAAYYGGTYTFAAGDVISFDVSVSFWCDGTISEKDQDSGQQMSRGFTRDCQTGIR